METSDAGSTSPREAAALLAEAETDRRRLTEQLTLPTLFCTTLGAAIAAQIATTALGLGLGGAWLAVGLPVGLAALALVAVVQLLRFRRENRVWVNGLATQVVGGTANAASGPYAATLACATWAALDRQWWLVVVSAVVGGVAYALAGSYWWRRFRADPVAHRGESMIWLAVLVVAALGGLILVAVAR